jgi:hypothetical protein
MLEINKINIFDEKFDEKIKNLASKSNIENDSINYFGKIDVEFFNHENQMEKNQKKKKTSFKCIKEVVTYSCMTIPVLIFSAVFIYLFYTCSTFF